MNRLRARLLSLPMKEFRFRLCIVLKCSACSCLLTLTVEWNPAFWLVVINLHLINIIITQASSVFTLDTLGLRRTGCKRFFRFFPAKIRLESRPRFFPQLKRRWSAGGRGIWLRDGYLWTHWAHRNHSPIKIYRISRGRDCNIFKATLYQRNHCNNMDLPP